MGYGKVRAKRLHWSVMVILDASPTPQKAPTRVAASSMTTELLSRKRVLNPHKNNPQDSRGRIAGCFAAMGTTFKASGERLYFALSIALLVACATNLTLACSWL
jgi:hypothetical protein